MNILTGQLPWLLSGQAISNTSGNGTDIMDKLLASISRSSPLLQGFLFVYRLLEQRFGLDPSIILTIVCLVWGLAKVTTQLHKMAAVLLDRYQSSIIISQDDPIYKSLMEFFSKQPALVLGQHLMAQTRWFSPWDENEKEDRIGTLSTDNKNGDGAPVYLNFSNQATQSDPRYVPTLGSTGFWHNGTYVRISRLRQPLVDTDGRSAMRECEEIKISCYGRSAGRLKTLIADARADYHKQSHQLTAIWRPRASEFRREDNMWAIVARRPTRPMRTVVLDRKEKKEILADINEYLHPATPKWYAARGIPLRRGYLFYGPPGTGKTSFCFALAGVFGIDIYVVSLQDVNVTEEDLAVLFAKLPRRCIVLLEDIDTAGLKCDDDPDKAVEVVENGDSKTIGKNSKNKKRNKAKTRAVKNRQELKAGTQGRSSTTVSMGAISLAGLLAAIDGVASHEGRLLIMTTNKPESLDEALVRPGRVDRQVSFTNASSSQARELFYRIYEDEKANQEESQLQKLAEDFGKLVPENEFSPAEIQGFLLTRKGNPQKAIEDASDWIEATKTRKEAKSQVKTVQ